jgi:hypothetical protein
MGRRAMRLGVLAAGLGILVIGAVILGTNALAPAPAGERLAGVEVAVANLAIEDLDEGRHRLRLAVTITSEGDLDECLAFALDQAFAHRRMTTADGACIRPVAGQRIAALVFDGLTDDDLLFPAHTVVWGVPGGRCGIVLELLGICVVDFAGTADLELPSRDVLPSLGPFDSFGPIVPIFTFEPP